MHGRIIGLLGVVGLCFLPAAFGGAEPQEKIEICHVPPGNPENAHFISVSGNALRAHLEHGDPDPADMTGCPPEDGEEQCIPEGPEEICGDNVDNNCVGGVDENCTPN